MALSPKAEQRRARIVSVEALAAPVRLLRLEPEGGKLPFWAGQYARLTFAGQPARDYSIASPEGSATLDFHIRDMGHGPSAYACRETRPGDIVHLEGPQGQCHLRRQGDGPILAIAGGTGLAPMKSIVETALANQKLRRVALYSGVRTEADLYLVDHFRDLAKTHANFAYWPLLSEPDAPTDRRVATLGDAVAQDMKDLSGWQVYLAGAPAMVEAVTPRLVAAGAAGEDIHADAFYGDAEMRRRLTQNPESSI